MLAYIRIFKFYARSHDTGGKKFIQAILLNHFGDEPHAASSQRSRMYRRRNLNKHCKLALSTHTHTHTQETIKLTLTRLSYSESYFHLNKISDGSVVLQIFISREQQHFLIIFFLLYRDSFLSAGTYTMYI